jgi:hypothetical protein
MQGCLSTHYINVGLSDTLSFDITGGLNSMARFHSSTSPLPQSCDPGYVEHGVYVTSDYLTWHLAATKPGETLLVPVCCAYAEMSHGR